MSEVSSLLNFQVIHGKPRLKLRDAFYQQTIFTLGKYVTVHENRSWTLSQDIKKYAKFYNYVNRIYRCFFLMMNLDRKIFFSCIFIYSGNIYDYMKYIYRSKYFFDNHEEKNIRNLTNTIYLCTLITDKNVSLID